MDAKLTDDEEMDLIRKWFDKKTTYEIYRLLTIILKDKKENK
jgi:hypothetical protein